MINIEIKNNIREFSRLNLIKAIGTAITLATLYEAIKLGYKISVLRASEMGLNIYKKLDVEEYCRFKFYQFIVEMN